MHDDPVADFGPEGPLARQLPHYRPREGQLQMAADVADALWQQSALVAEAGTGIGKTYAYLVPLLRDGRRAIVATHTPAACRISCTFRTCHGCRPRWARARPSPC